MTYSYFKRNHYGPSAICVECLFLTLSSDSSNRSTTVFFSRRGSFSTNYKQKDARGDLCMFSLFWLNKRGAIKGASFREISLVRLIRRFEPIKQYKWDF